VRRLNVDLVVAAAQELCPRCGAWASANVRLEENPEREIEGAVHGEEAPRLAEICIRLGQESRIDRPETEPAELLSPPQPHEIVLGVHRVRRVLDQDVRHARSTIPLIVWLRGVQNGHKIDVARAIWSGTISFGLVSIPVRMFSAVSEHKLHFHLVHRDDESPIGYEKVCKLEAKPVPDSEIVKAYEIKKGELVYVEDEDFEAARTGGAHAFEITDFVSAEEIDPIYFERSYYLAPQNGGEKVYTLLVRAMEDAGLAAVGTFVMRDREYVGCLRIREGVITLERMYFADEIRPADELRPERARVGKQEIEMAAALIDRFKGSFDPAKYSDTYTDRLIDVIKRKRRGEEVHAAPEPEPEEAPDLMEALRASLEAHKRTQRRAAPRRKGPARRGSGGRRGSRTRSRR
jgi:DNA end-binding protein Ku